MSGPGFVPEAEAGGLNVAPTPPGAAKVTYARPGALAGLLVAALACALYLTTLPNDFVIDDRAIIIDNTFLRRSDALKQIFTTDVWGFFGRDAGSSYYRPLMYTFWLPLWRTFHASPVGYHALNILLHAAVSLLVFFWLRRIQASAATALLAALLFAAHPVHVEAVAWVSALPDLQCTLFFLLGFWLYLTAESAAGWRRYAMQTGVAACVLLALLAKEIGFILPLALAAYATSRDGHSCPSNPRRGRIFLYTGAAVAFAAYLAMRWHALGSLIPSSGLSISAGKLFAGWLALLYEYTLRIVLPIKLSAFHVIPIPVSFFEPKVVVGLGIAGGSCALAFWLHRRGRIEWLGVLLFAVALVPTFLAPLRENGLWMGERYLYLPSIGFCWLLAAGLEHVSRRVGWRPAAVFALVVLAGYTARTIYRTQDWGNEIPFYLHELQAEGESPQVRPLLTEALLRRGMPERALEDAQAMVRLAPHDPRAHNSLGFIYWALAKQDEALKEYRLAAEYAREQGQAGFAARALNNIAVVHSQNGRMDLAIPAYQEAVRLDSNFADGHNNLGAALFTAGRLEEAEAHLRAAIRLNAAMVSAHSNLGLLLAARHDLSAARTALSEALRIEPDNAETLARAGEVDLLAGDRRSARQSFSRALALDRANPRALRGLSFVPEAGDLKAAPTQPGAAEAHR